MIALISSSLEVSSPTISLQSMYSSSCFSFSVFTPTVFPPDVDSVLSHRSLQIVQDHCIATNGEVHYTRLYHSVSVPSSPGSAPLTLHQFLEVVPVSMEFLHFIIPLRHNSIPSPTDTTICSAIPQLKGIPSFSNFWPPQRVQLWIFLYRSFSLSLWGTNPAVLWLDQRAGSLLTPFGHSSNCLPE